MRVFLAHVPFFASSVYVSPKQLGRPWAGHAPFTLSDRLLFWMFPWLYQSLTSTCGDALTLHTAVLAFQAWGQDKYLAALVWPKLWRAQVSPGLPGPGNSEVLSDPGVLLSETRRDTDSELFVTAASLHSLTVCWNKDASWGVPVLLGSLIQASAPWHRRWGGGGGLARNVMVKCLLPEPGAHRPVFVLGFHIRCCS